MKELLWGFGGPPTLEDIFFEIFLFWRRALGPPHPWRFFFEKKKVFIIFFDPKKIFACGALMPPHRDFRSPVWAESPYLMFIYLYTKTTTATRRSNGGEGPTGGTHNDGDRGSKIKMLIVHKSAYKFIFWPSNLNHFFRKEEFRPSWTLLPPSKCRLWEKKIFKLFSHVHMCTWAYEPILGCIGGVWITRSTSRFQNI